MDPLDNIALLQIAVLQQDLLERDVEEARKKEEEKTQKISDPSMAGRGKEEAVSRYYARLMEKLRVRSAVFLQLYLKNQDGACHV